MRPWGTCGYCGGRGPESLTALAARRARVAAVAADGEMSPATTHGADAVPGMAEVAARARAVPAGPPAGPVPSATARSVPVAPKAAPARRKFRPMDLWKRYLPPVRLVWLSLAIFVIVGGGLLNRSVAVALLALPLLGGVADVAFQRIRFPRLRFPDAAVATGLFLAIIIWPANLDLPLVAIAVITVAVRHLLRRGGHPILNPAGAGVVLATIVFAMPTSWHLPATTTMAVLVTLLGALLIVKAPHTWRFPAYFYPAYLLVGVNTAFVLGGAANVLLFLTAGTLTAGSIFFALFMVTEPRTAPSARWAMPIFAIVVGAASAGLPVVFTEVPAISALGVIAPFLALFVGNGLTIALPSTRGAVRPTAPAGAPPARAIGRAGPSMTAAHELAR